MVRYAARGEQRNREVEAVTAEIWSTAITAVFETDADVIAAVLPPPLEPSRDASTARLRIATVDMGTGLKPFGAGWFGVRCRHGEVEGEYALFMPMTTEQATIGGRETFGEPKKIADVSLNLDGDRISGSIQRMGFVVAELGGTLVEARDDYERDKVDFYFKALPSPDGAGLDGDPAFVYCHRLEKGRNLRVVDGELKLLESPLDPVADIPINRIVSIEYGELATYQTGEIVGRVPAADIAPFIHQRYDDLSVLGARK